MIERLQNKNLKTLVTGTRCIELSTRLSSNELLFTFKDSKKHSIKIAKNIFQIIKWFGFQTNLFEKLF